MRIGLKDNKDNRSGWRITTPRWSLLQTVWMKKLTLASTFNNSDFRENPGEMLFMTHELKNWEEKLRKHVNRYFLQQGGGRGVVIVGMAFWTSSLINIVYPHATEILLYPLLHQQVTTARDHICQPEGADWDFRFMAPTFLHSSLDGLAGQWQGVIGCAASRICDRRGNLPWWYFTCLHLWQICC